VPTFGSLFAGIGGIDLGLERAGWECRFQVEWDAYCQRVLAKHWPDVPRYGDISAVDWSGVERVDLLAGGFPCQPVSTSGRKEAQSDARWLWPEFRRAIRELRPELVLVENVTNLLGVNDGTAFGDVLGDLATIGYDAEWDCIPASALGADHDRDRVWIVAYPARGNAQDARWLASDVGLPHSVGPPAGHQHGGVSAVRDHAPQPAMAGMAHGFPSRVDRLRSLGNAVVPQVVEWIGRRLLEAYEAEREVA
jgi:DNA (cytosine-5)-methyltransferase 1